MDGHWYVDLRIEGKRVRWRSPVDTKRGSQQYEAVLRGRALAGEPLDGVKPKEDEPTRAGPECLSEWLDEWVEIYATNNNKPSEVSGKKGIIHNHLKPAMGSLRLEQVGIEQIERFKSRQLGSGLHPKSVNNQLTVLRKALATAVDWRLIDHVPPIKWLKLPPQDFDFFNQDESNRLLAATPPEHLAMVVTALKTGLRIGELLALRWEHVDLVAGVLRVRRAVWKGREGAPKNGQPRDIPMTPLLIERLKAHRHLRGPYVFCHEDGRPLTRDSLKRVLPPACRRAGLRPIQWHSLRHSFASQLVMAGVPLKAVQELLGHADIRMTMRYAHLAPSVLKEAVSVLDGELNGHSRGQYLGSGAPGGR
jgi:integrase